MSFEEKIQADYVFGRNNVTEVLQSGLPVERVYLAGDPQNSNHKKIVALCKTNGVPIIHTEMTALHRKLPNVNHQGVLAICGQKEYFECGKGTGRSAVYYYCR